jgi:GntR family transcriptional regulator, arabinose operon transcriptional repressor
LNNISPQVIGNKLIVGIFKADDLQGFKRQVGFEAALVENNTVLKPEFLGNYETEQLLSYPYQFIKSILSKVPWPTAIVCYNDQIALKVIEAIRDEGLKIPDDISLIGYDDSSLAMASEIKLTTIKHGASRAARFITDMVGKRAEKPRFIYHISLN